MNKVKKIVIIGTIVLVLGLFIEYFYTKDNEDSNLLAVHAHYNYAKGYQFNGSAIMDDGTIYKWDITKIPKENYDVSTEEGLKDLVFAKGHKAIKKVSKEDLGKIKEYISKLKMSDKDYDVDCRGTDIGEAYISVYEQKTERKLKRSGDCSGESKTDVAKELILLIDKYLK